MKSYKVWNRCLKCNVKGYWSNCPKCGENLSSTEQIRGYGGLHYTKNLIVPFFPKNIKRFIEPFAGMGRITELVDANEYMINDKSEYAFNILREKFPDYIIENIDFKDFIRKYDDGESFIFCDPPWRKNIYNNHKSPVFTLKNVKMYYQSLLHILSDSKSHWIITSDRAEVETGKLLQKSIYPNITLEAPDGSPRFYSRLPAVRLCSNKEFESITNPLTVEGERQ